MATKKTHKSKAERVAAGNTTRAATAPHPGSKIGKVIALLKRKPGATIEELAKATGWQPHSTRAALTGLKKKGHTIEKSKRHGVTCYAIKGGT